MRIHGDINDLLKLGTINTLYAPYDAYPNLDWTLATQFDNKSAILEDLKNNYNLKNRKYFQTGILFYDTSIIKKNTFKYCDFSSSTYCSTNVSQTYNSISFW